MYSKIKYLLIAIFILFTNIRCKKYLDAKPDKHLVVPATVQDLQAILDNTRKLNFAYSCAGETASDNLYLTTKDWKARSITDKNSYIWGDDVFNDNELNDWSLDYIVVYYANVVLDQLKKEESIAGSEVEKDNVRGQALFFRSFAFYDLLQIFAKAFTPDSAKFDLGIPLRLTSDLNEKTVRSTVLQSYNQIIGDVKESVTLLPDNALVKTRPSKQAAYAFLARVYLTIMDYSNALKYADSALSMNATLMDFNSLNSHLSYPITRFNPEVIFHTILGTKASLIPPICKVDSLLYESYDSNDLRREVFFKVNNDGTVSFKGSYDGTILLFNGLSTDEMYLIRAECYARKGDAALAMNDLNTLLKMRWKKDAFIPITFSNADDALKIILTERRKELLFRGLRWTDLRRLNQDKQFATTIERVLDGQVYTLEPNDPRYVFPIPVNVIQMTGIQQNIR